VRLFRPDMNMKRMNTSANRIALPVRKFVFGSYNSLLRPSIYKLQTFDGVALLELIKELVRLDKHWIPKEAGHSLYIRPTLSKLSQPQLLAFADPHILLQLVLNAPLGSAHPTKLSSSSSSVQSDHSTPTDSSPWRSMAQPNSSAPLPVVRFLGAMFLNPPSDACGMPCRHWRLQARC
jgi:hypothetical protein